MQFVSHSRASEILKNAEGSSIAVIGDIMLDRYFWGNVSRISPESPVPVVDVEKETFHLGGAANVANNLKSLGISPLLCGVLGNDGTGKTFTDIAEENGINTAGLFHDDNRPTTVKTRIIGNNQQIARLDREVREQISPESEAYILNALKKEKNLSGIIFEDYNKGTNTVSLIKEVIENARSRNIPVFVDPKFDNFFEYKHVTVFKPNRKEALKALSTEINSKEDIISIGRELVKKLECDNLLLTLGSDGMMLFEAGGNYYSVPTRARHVADVSGAGDTAIATLSVAKAGGANIREAATMANYASGVVCEMPGIVSITPETLIKAIQKNNNHN